TPIRSQARSSLVRGQPAELYPARTVPTVDEQGAAGWRWLRSGRSDQRALVRAAVHHQAGRGQFAQTAEQRIEERAPGPTAAPGDDQVQPDVLGLRQELHERQQG